jgi:murein DD-endopeptidase MepM/ murein hydrolase activator NlpD
LGLLLLGVVGLLILAGVYAVEGSRHRASAPRVLHGGETPPLAEAFDYPLIPFQAYAPIVSAANDTRYGVPNPAWGNHANCFRDVHGAGVPFRWLYHAGIDLFALDAAGQANGPLSAGAAVHAVADGLIFLHQDAGSSGHILILAHRLPNDERIYSAYWHVDHVQVAVGERVVRGQVIAQIYDQGYNSHLHWEMQTFGDGSAMFPPGTAGARGTCNGRIPGVGYTWDDDPARAHPAYYGYRDPVAFVEAH